MYTQLWHHRLLARLVTGLGLFRSDDDAIFCDQMPHFWGSHPTHANIKLEHQATQTCPGQPAAKPGIPLGVVFIVRTDPNADRAITILGCPVAEAFFAID